MRIIIFGLLLALGFASEAIINYTPVELTADAVNYRINTVKLAADNSLMFKITVTNLSDKPAVINTDSWLLLETATRHRPVKPETYRLSAGSIKQFEIFYLFSRSEDLNLHINDRVIFDLKYLPIDRDAYQEYYPQSTVIIRSKDHYYLQRNDKKYILVKNNDHQQLIAEAYLVVPEQNIALQKIDFKHFLGKMQSDASHLLIYYYNQPKELVKLGSLPHYFPEDIAVNYQVSDQKLQLSCSANRQFTRVTAVVSGKYFALSRHDSIYQVTIPLSEIAPATKVKLYFLENEALYSSSITLNKSYWNSL